jgi:hypothetical protein
LNPRDMTSRMMRRSVAPSAMRTPSSGHRQRRARRQAATAPVVVLRRAERHRSTPKGSLSAQGNFRSSTAERRNSGNLTQRRREPRRRREHQKTLLKKSSRKWCSAVLCASAALCVSASKITQFRRSAVELGKLPPRSQTEAARGLDTVVDGRVTGCTGVDGQGAPRDGTLPLIGEQFSTRERMCRAETTKLARKRSYRRRRWRSAHRRMTARQG